MEKTGLLFIPDISGFTRFVNGMEIEHSRHIIQELLEVLIDANEMGLEISEIEGDAILFYRYGESPDLAQLYAQIERMFCDFHRHLKTYDAHRLCQCKACITAIDLSLKVVTHYGEFTGYNVKNFSKLIGKDVIVAHQLLKNDIAEHEYWLVTPGLLHDRSPGPLKQWMQWNNSTKSTESTESGEVAFHYTQLGRLKEEIKPLPAPQLEARDKVKAVSVTRDYDASPLKMFYTAGHFEFRHQWQEGVKAVDQVDHFLPGIGTRHRHVMDDGKEVILFTSGFHFDPENRIDYSETSEDQTRTFHFGFERLDGNRTRFSLELYLKKALLAVTLFNLTERRTMEQRFERSLANLVTLVRDIEIPFDL